MTWHRECFSTRKCSYRPPIYADRSTGQQPMRVYYSRCLTRISLIAMAQAASFYKLVCPNMVQENIIKISGGR